MSALTIYTTEAFSQLLPLIQGAIDQTTTLTTTAVMFSIKESLNLFVLKMFFVLKIF